MKKMDLKTYKKLRGISGIVFGITVIGICGANLIQDFVKEKNHQSFVDGERYVELLIEDMINDAYGKEEGAKIWHRIWDE